jgi:hypothetical protein
MMVVMAMMAVIMLQVIMMMVVVMVIYRKKRKQGRGKGAGGRTFGVGVALRSTTIRKKPKGEKKAGRAEGAFSIHMRGCLSI